MNDLVGDAIYGALGAHLELGGLAVLMASKGLDYGDSQRVARAHGLIERAVQAGWLRTEVRSIMVPVPGEFEVFVPYGNDLRHPSYTPPAQRKPSEAGEWRIKVGLTGPRPSGSRPRLGELTLIEVAADAVGEWLAGMGSLADEWRSDALTKWIDAHAAVTQRLAYVQAAVPECISRGRLNNLSVFKVRSTGESRTTGNTINKLRNEFGLTAHGRTGAYLLADLQAAAELAGLSFDIDKARRALQDDL